MPFFDLNIVQIVPASGWLALYAGTETEPLIVSRVAVWALAEAKDGDRGVYGYEGGEFLQCCEEADNHLAYLHESELEEGRASWTEEALAHMARRAARP